MSSRVVLVFSSFALIWSLLLLRVFVLQVFPHAQLDRLESRQYETTVKIQGRRGTIYDRNGVELAISTPAYSLYADPKLIGENQEKVSRQLEKIFHGNYRTFKKLIKDKNKRFVWVQRQLSSDLMESIKKINIKGLGFIEEPVRVYPDESLLKPILGTVGRNDMGLEGLEKQYDSALRGNPKNIQVRRDARGRPTQLNGLLVTEIEEGHDLQLTIDRELQYVLHRELQSTLNEQNAAGAVGVILDAQTSEVRAMDSIGLSLSGESSELNLWRNRSILDSFEPGSTMKTFIIGAGLQKKNWQPNTKFNCENGKLKIGRETIGESDAHHSFGWLTISEILAFSSNIGVTKMAFSLGQTSVKEILSSFGFGRKTGIDLPGEAKGIIKEGLWSDHLLSNISFGHGLSVTALQMANAYAAIANGGELKIPRLVKQVQILPGVRILKESEAQTLKLLLAGVMAPNGTGASAVVPGYPVAGKTGTAQKVNPKGRGYLPGAYISSFVGMIPANNPRFVIYVAVDSPKKQYYGSQVAGPLFSKIASFAVRHEGLSPQWLNEQQAKGLWSDPKEIKKLNIANLNGPLLNTLEDMENLNLMPELSDLSLREAQEQLQYRALKVSIHGSGSVKKFFPEAGTKLSKNDLVEIWLK